MNDAIQLAKLELSDLQVNVLLAIVLSVSRRQSDAYLSYVNLTSKNESVLEFNQIKSELRSLGLIRIVNDKGEGFIYFTPEGLSFAIVACEQESYRVHRRIELAVRSSGAHYARFIASGFTQYCHRYQTNDELMEQSINDGLHLLSKSSLLWLLTPPSEVVIGYGDYFLQTWLSLIASAHSAKTYQSLNAALPSHVKAKIPVHFVADAPLFSNKPIDAAHFLRKLDVGYLEARTHRFSVNHNTRLSFSSLIDLFILKNLQPELAGELMEQYQSLTLIQRYVLGFYPWGKEFDYLSMSDDRLVELFFDANMWLESVVDGDKLKWGRLVLELLQMSRVKDRPELSGFVEQLAAHSLTQHILALTPDFNLMRLGQQLLRHLIGVEPMIDKPDMWGLWVRNVESLFNAEKSVGEERVVWVLLDNNTVCAKVQKKGKKGWSRGRQVTLQNLSFSYREELTESDIALMSHFERGSYGWREEHALSKSSLSLLSRANNVVNQQGQPISIVPDPSLLIVGERDGLLDLGRFPKTERSELELLKERAPGILTFDSTPDNVKRFFALSESMPSVPSGYVDSLIPLLGNDIDWYCPSEQKGNIDVGVWDERPHLWLNLVDGRLDLSIEHQSLEGTVRVPSASGENWLHQDGRTWFNRDLEQERVQLTQLRKALGFKKRNETSLVVASEDISDVLNAIASLDNVPVHWHTNSKQVKTINAQDVDLEINKKGEWFSLTGEVVLDGGLVLDLQRLLESRRSGYIEIKEQNLTLLVNDALRKQLNLLDSVLNEELSVNTKMAYPLQKLVETMSISSDQGWKALEQEWSKPIMIEPQRLVVLRDYQRTSVHWAIHLLTHGFGACLADDMGLGKTLQALKVIEYFTSSGPSLVVCPKSVLINWQQEAERFTPQLSILDLETSANRAQVLTEAKAGEVVLMSYGLVTRLAKELEEVEWQSVVLDEAQQIKNPNAQRTKVLVNLNAQRRITLSGTPVENHLVELWSQFSFLNPGLLGSLKQFKTKYGQASKNEEDMFRLRALVSPFIMRRLKNEVLTELPEKTELVHHIELSAKERSAYEAVRQDSLRISESLDKGSSIKLFAALTRLRQVCCDPYLVFDTMPEASSKLKEALHLVHEARQGGHKILIFSQFVQLLKRFSALLETEALAFSYLDGQSNTKKRKQAIEDFKSGKHDLFLISLKAGGAGLNLTEADTVIHLDPWWNPAVEDQASDRAYRMGQTNPVTVYRLVATNTIEEKIIQLHEDKRDLADKVLSGQSEASHLKPEMLLDLLSD
ncbi:DEAD/DEAH box helicase [Vibrio sp. SG41-7]|uniref:DEAD/DEAH box helicase n=1 Tax=Vibrio sp. SG41-7 TaxID=2760973 RepID=UPI00160088C7|nr:DEAD/DEAH box helicase [Vibrio sp. SG41-7]MBB1465195.1 DEAD/DEAH box helicase [Vibrio sp. SG41-7]